jgi:deazaflavin-dependent oxidoreductase (nitroreductase family)
MSFFTNVWNQFNKFILPSSLHKITSNSTLLITFTGKKSGMTFTTPVNYTQMGNTLRITSLRTRRWWQNLKTNPEVIITLRGNTINGVAEVSEDHRAVANELKNYIQPAPRMARFFNVAVNPDGSFNENDLFKSAEGRVVIKVEIRDLTK